MDGERKPAVDDDQDEPTEKPLGRDDRVSFYPMDPEEVLKKLLRTPPMSRNKGGSTGDEGDDGRLLS